VRDGGMAARALRAPLSQAAPRLLRAPGRRLTQHKHARRFTSAFLAAHRAQEECMHSRLTPAARPRTVQLTCAVGRHAEHVVGVPACVAGMKGGALVVTSGRAFCPAPRRPRQAAVRALARAYCTRAARSGQARPSRGKTSAAARCAPHDAARLDAGEPSASLPLV
jgi:hypothetical protein